MAKNKKQARKLLRDLLSHVDSLSTYQAAKTLGVDASYVGYLRRGKRIPNLDKFVLMADNLDLEIRLSKRAIKKARKAGSVKKTKKAKSASRGG